MSRNLNSRRKIADAIRMIVRAEVTEEDRDAAEDLLALLGPWETGVIHGRAPGFPQLENGPSNEPPDTLYG